MLQVWSKYYGGCASVHERINLRGEVMAKIIARENFLITNVFASNEILHIQTLEIYEIRFDFDIKDNLSNQLREQVFLSLSSSSSLMYLSLSWN